MKHVWIVLIAMALQVPAPRTGTIEGTVRDKTSGLPLAGVRVLADRGASTLSEVPAVYQAVTDGTGRFSIPGAIPGSYAVRVIDEKYLQSGPDFSGILLAGQRLTVSLSLSRRSSIQGRITGVDGQGIAGLPVQFLALRVDERGRRTWSTQGPATQTDSDGEYRQSELLPGTYYVRTILSMPGGSRRVIYYPGTPVAGAAAPLILGEGGSLSADFQTDAGRLTGRRISGRITHSLERTASSPSMTLTLSLHDDFAPLETGNLKVYAASTIADDDTGSFEFRGIPPGIYDLIAAAVIRQNNYVTALTVEVRDDDIDNLVVALKPGVDVSGVVRLDSDPREIWKRPAILDALRLSLKRKDGFLLAPETIILRPAGRETPFRFSNVPEGEYDIEATLRVSDLPLPAMAPPENAYISDISMPGGSVFDLGLHVGTTPIDGLEVEVGGRGGTITGTVPGKEAVAGVVFLVPERPRQANPLLYRRVLLIPNNETGHFELRGIAPGAYKLFAVADSGDTAFRSVQFISQYESRALSVTIEKDALLTVEVPWLR